MLLQEIQEIHIAYTCIFPGIGGFVLIFVSISVYIIHLRSKSPTVSVLKTKPLAIIQINAINHYGGGRR